MNQSSGTWQEYNRYDYIISIYLVSSHITNIVFKDIRRDIFNNYF